MLLHYLLRKCIAWPGAGKPRKLPWMGRKRFPHALQVTGLACPVCRSRPNVASSIRAPQEVHWQENGPPVGWGQEDEVLLLVSAALLVGRSPAHVGIGNEKMVWHRTDI